MKNNRKTFARRALALLLAVMMCFSMVMSAAATDNTYKLCTKDEHIHGPECYKYSFLDCKHTVDNMDAHSEACGVTFPTHEDGCPVVGTKGVECSHTHDETCRYIASVESKAEVPCNHQCSQGTCGEPETNEEGKTTYPHCTHAQDGNHTDCAYQPAVERVEGHECLHGTESDPCTKDRCGYVEAVEADPEAECQCQLEERTANAIQQCTHLQGTHTAECYGDFKSWDELTADQQAIITSIKNSAGGTKFSALADQFGINSTAHIVRSVEAVCGEEEHIHAENNCITKTGDTFTDTDLQTAVSNGGTIDLNNQEVKVNSTITVGNGKTVTFTGGGTLQAASAGLANVIKVVTGGTLTLNDVTIDGAEKARGVYVGGGNLTVGKGATIQNGRAFGAVNNDNFANGGGGGGIMVDGGTFTMTGGTIKDNKAVKKDGKAAEGGGIYIRGGAVGTINAGQITNNETETTSDLGGGGIYVNNDGTLNLTNLIVTQNTADGLGGGFAACMHGRTVIYGGDHGAAIYGNTGSGNTSLSLSNGRGGEMLVDQSGTKSHWDTNGTFKQKADDIFAANMMGETPADGGGNPGVIVSNDMLGGLQAGWNGYVLEHHDPDCPIAQSIITSGYPSSHWYGDKHDCQCNNKTGPTAKPVSINNDGVIYSGNVMGLTADSYNTDAATKNALDTLYQNVTDGLAGFTEYVLISGNSSAMHGGGIANNGIVYIGSKASQNLVTSNGAPISLQVAKNWSADDNTFTGQVTFTLSDSNGKQLDSVTVTGNSGEGILTIPANVLTFPVTDTTGDTSKTLSFTLSEMVSATNGTVTKRGDVSIKVTVNYTVAEAGKVGNTTMKKGTFSSSISSITTPEGVTSEGNKIAFTNTYTRHRGSLTVNKSVVNNTALDLARETYSFTITGESLKNDTKHGYTVTEGATLQDNGIEAGTLTLTVPVSELNGSATISGLPTGTYTVTENNVKVSGPDDEGSERYTQDVEVTATDNSIDGPNDSAVFDVKNTYDYQYSGLTFKKTVNFDGQDSEKQDDFDTKTFTFQLTQGDDCVTTMSSDKVQKATVSGDGKTATVEVKGDGKEVTVTGLPVGTYTVKELNARDEAEAKDYTLTVAGEDDYQVVYGTVKPVEITNDYGYTRGGLSIRKIVDGTADKAVTDAKEYSFTIKADKTYVNGSYSAEITDYSIEPSTTPDTEGNTQTPATERTYSKNVDFKDGTATVAITGPGSIRISGLPTGKYTITEADANLENTSYNWSASGNNAVVEVKNGETASAEVTNNYWVRNIPVTRSLNVNKVWAGDEDSLTARPDSIQVQLYLNGAAYGSPVTLSAANGWSYSWLGLPTGGALTVEELNVPDGYAATTASSGNAVTITNTYEEEIPEPTPPLGTPRPTSTPAPTPTPIPGGTDTPTPVPTPTPDPDEEIPDDNVPLGTPKPEPTPNPDEELPDPDVPKAPAEPEEDIPDDDVPLANTPKTGDSRDIWYLLTFLSAAGLVLVAATGRKKSGQSK